MAKRTVVVVLDDHDDPDGDLDFAFRLLEDRVVLEVQEDIAPVTVTVESTEVSI